MPAFFNGRLYESPISATQINDSGMAPQSTPSPNEVLLIGTALGGEPNKPLQFWTPEAAQTALVGGDLLDAALHAFAPSTSLPGPAFVRVIRVGPATQSTLTLKGGSDVNSIRLTSANWGVRTNQIRVAVEAGSSAGLVKIVITRGNDYIPSPDLASIAEAVRWLNRAGSVFVTAEALPTAAWPLTPAAAAAMTGGTDGTPTNTHWQAAFDAAKSLDSYWLATTSTNSAIHAMADAHALYMSTHGRRERRVIVGTALETTDAAAITAAKALNSDRTALVHLGFWDYDAQGALKLYPPPVLAAMLAGAFAGVDPGVALTNKSIRVRGLERNLANPADTDPLISGGVLPVETTDRGYKVVRSISTWRKDNNYNRVELSCGAALDTVVRRVRTRLETFIGERGNPLVLQQAASAIDSELRDCARDAPAGPGLIVGDAENPAFRGIKVTLQGDVLCATFECSPVVPINYVFTTIYAEPYSGSVVIA